MAKVLLEKIGGAIDSFLPNREYANNQENSRKLRNEFQAKRDEVKSGWGESYVKRVHKRNKMTVWERIDFLKDSGSHVFPIGTFVNYGLEFGGRTSPAAGVVTAFVKIAGKYTMVIGNDNTVASGSWWPMTPEKIERAQEISLRLRIPVIYLVDCSGLYLPEQSKTFSGFRGAGHIFKMNSVLSAHQVPQIAGVFGDCIAGGGYMPIISDVVYMTEQAYMVIAGAALVKGGKGQKITSLDIGGPNVHVHLSNCADYRVPDDTTCLLKIREEIEKVPTSAIEYYRYGAKPAPPRFASIELDGIFPKDYRMAYQMREVIARLVDDSLFWELLPEQGKEMICGIGRVSGLYMGFIGNNPLLSEHPTSRSKRRSGNILYRQGIAKISAFSRACDSDGIPIVWLQDISGFDIGPEAERHGLLGYGSNLIYTNSTNKTPMITILLRKASGAGYYAMSGAPYDPVLQLSTPITRLAVMEGRTLAIAAYHTKLDENFCIVANSEQEREKIRKDMENVEQRISEDMNPLVTACELATDEIVFMGELRMRLEAIAEMCYQSIGYRRVKNPRIWTMHDIQALYGASAI